MHAQINIKAKIPLMLVVLSSNPKNTIKENKILNFPFCPRS